MPDSRIFTMACVNILGVCDDIAPSGNNATTKADIKNRIHRIDNNLCCFEGEPLSKST